jgi:site-specific recombinase XerD
VDAVGTWDKGLEFEPTLRKLLEFRKFVRSRIVRPRYRAALRNVNILILALLNGLRISEAIECYYRWLESQERKIVVKIAKSKDRYRLCLVPEAFDKVDWAATRGLPKPLKQTLNSFARRHFNFNTHSLRYAFINYLLSRGVDVPTVSRIVGHRSLNTILSYIQSRRAEETLESIQELLRRFVR